MMAGSRVIFSYEGIGELLRSDFAEAHLRERADRMKDFAEVIAPVSTDRKNPHRGRYLAEFSVSTTRHGGFRRDRAQATLTNTSPEAVFVETGTSRQRGQHVLRRAMTDGARD
jgi:hypothetical protein